VVIAVGRKALRVRLGNYLAAGILKDDASVRGIPQHRGGDPALEIAADLIEGAHRGGDGTQF
jgi:hypothetical protein